MTDEIWKLRSPSAKEVPGNISNLGYVDPNLLAEVPCIKTIIDNRKYLPVHTYITNGIDSNGDSDDKHYADYANIADTIIKEIDKNTPIVISGDYDVDGMTATAVLYTCLKKAGADVGWFIPSRETDGYGLCVHKLEKILKPGTLIITVDNGIAEVDNIAKLKADGFRVIVTDHHIPDMKNLPDAYAILNPKVTQSPDDDEYMASGCYVAAKLGLTIFKRSGHKFDSDLTTYCEALTGLSIISDVIELNPLMWHMLTYGLIALNNTNHSGLKALLNMCGCKSNADITAKSLLWNVTPKLNAVGRMDKAQAGMDILLLEEDTSSGKTDSLLMANTIKMLNNARKILENQITDEALALLSQKYPDIEKLPASLVVYSPKWRSGLIGIVAARLVELTHVPTVVLTGEGEEIHGSGRAPENCDLYSGLQYCDDLLTSFGGHKAAAGINLKRENLEAFITKFTEYYKTNKPAEFVREYDCEATLTELQDIRFQMFLTNIEPTGNKNPPLVIRVNNVLALNYSKRRDTTYFTINEMENKRNIAVSKYRAPEEWDEKLEGHYIDILITPNLSYYTGITVPEWTVVAIADREIDLVEAAYKKIKIVKHMENENAADQK